MTLPHVHPITARGMIATLLAAAVIGSAGGAEQPFAPLVARHCGECHSGPAPEAGLAVDGPAGDLADAAVRERFVLMHDRVAKGQMPPTAADLPAAERADLLAALSAAIVAADREAIGTGGRVPLRRLNRLEYQETLRDILELPTLDVADRLPEDRIRDGFITSAEGLDFSRIQLAAHLDAAHEAVTEAVASGTAAAAPDRFVAIATGLFNAHETFGERQAMFFAKDGRMLPLSPQSIGSLRRTRLEDPAIECCIFRSAYWPYYGYPAGFVAKRRGVYRVRFRARAVLQQPGFEIVAATRPVPLSFRARRPSGPDVSGDVRAVGGIFDIPPEATDFETTAVLDPGQTIEYSLLGLPVPLARNVAGGPPTYRYPPFPPGGQPGVAIQRLEIEGPMPPAEWPPASHRALFGDLPLTAAKSAASPAVDVVTDDPENDARRLLAAFATRATLAPLEPADLAPFERLVAGARAEGASFTRAMLTGYAALLCSPHVVYLPEPRADLPPAAAGRGAFPLAARLSYFLSGTRPDAPLLEQARSGGLDDAAGVVAAADRLMADPRFARFIATFTDYWLDLRHLRRDEPDVRLYPEYRFDDYLAESMGMETRAFVTALFRDNLPARSIVTTDFIHANDRLAAHYGLPPLDGHEVRRVPVPADSPFGGLLTQAAIQRVTANGTTTSPVVRGAWVMSRLLGQPPPKPPASVPAVEPDIRGATSIRDLLARHAADASCASCHRLFDPVGLALESFDICGGRRDRYRGVEEGEPVTGIDRAGHDFAYRLAVPVDPSGCLPDGRRFADIRELKRLLAADERQIARNLLQQLATHATGSPVRFADRSELERILDATAADGHRVGDLLRGLVASRFFRGLPPEDGAAGLSTLGDARP